MNKLPVSLLNLAIVFACAGLMMACTTTPTKQGSENFSATQVSNTNTYQVTQKNSERTTANTSPELLSDALVIIGTNECRTLRRAIFQRNGLIEIVVDRPISNRCTFKDLALVIDNIAIEGPYAVSGGIFGEFANYNGIQGTYYKWKSGSGSIFFKYNKPISKDGLDGKGSRSFGIVQINCLNLTSTACLTEPRLNSLTVSSLIAQGMVESSLESGDFESMIAAYKLKADKDLLAALVMRASNEKSVTKLLQIYAYYKDASVLDSAKKMATSKQSFDDLMQVYTISKDKEMLKFAYDIAATDQQKRAVELVLIDTIKDTLFDFKVTMSGTGKTSSSDTDIIFARRIETNVKSNLVHSGKLKTQIFSPKYDYVVDTTVTLIVEGVVNGKRACGLLFMSMCDVNNQSSSREFTYKVPMVFKRSSAYVSSGNTEIDWKSVSGGSGMASGLLLGGTMVFKANGAFKINVKVDSVSLLE